MIANIYDGLQYLFYVFLNMCLHCDVRDFVYSVVIFEVLWVRQLHNNLGGMMSPGNLFFWWIMVKINTSRCG